MKSLLITLGTLAMLSISTQLFRHIYVFAIAPTTSVLDKYDSETEKEIASSDSIEELVLKYEAVKRRFDENKKKWEELEDNIQLKRESAEWSKLQEANRTRDQISRAIGDWEARMREITEIHFFWWCGLTCTVLGLASFIWANRWLGITFMAIGFVEMIYWTSPTFRMLGGGLEFERLLMWKLIYTGVTFVLLLIMWGFSSWFGFRCDDGGATGRIESINTVEQTKAEQREAP